MICEPIRIPSGGARRWTDNGEPVFWFPGRDKAREIAKQMAMPETFIAVFLFMSTSPATME